MVDLKNSNYIGTDEKGYIISGSMTLSGLKYMGVFKRIYEKRTPMEFGHWFEIDKEI